MGNNIFMATRVLLLTEAIDFAMQAKTVLERDGHFEVKTFNNAASALAYVPTHPQSAAIIDCRVRDVAAENIIKGLRAAQPDMAIIVAPDTDAVRTLAQTLKLQAVVDLPIPLGTLVITIKNAVNQIYDARSASLTDTALSSDPGLMLNYDQTLEFWVSDNNQGELVVEATRPLDDGMLPTQQSSDLFNRLAAEEPPLPSARQGGTINHLQQQLINPQAELDISEIADEDWIETDDTNALTIPAAVLEALRDKRAAASLDNFRGRVNSLRADFEATIAADVDEPAPNSDILPVELPQFTGPLEYTSPTTVANKNQDTNIDPSSWRTDPIEPVRRSHPPRVSNIIERPTPPPPPELDRIARVQTEEEAPSEQPLQMPYTEYDAADPELAQMALTLTQVSLELTAEASLLARAGQVVAYAGKLPPEEIELISGQIGADWASVEQKARIRFVRIAEAGQDYMLYSRQLVEGFTLSLIFAGTMPVRNIRRQAQRLATALETIPEEEPQETSAPSVAVPVVDELASEIVVAEVGERTPMTFVLVLDQITDPLDADLRQESQEALQRQLARWGWVAHELAIEPSFCYLFADVPAETNAAALVEALLQTAATTIATQDPDRDADRLWDDSYLILQPGRDLAIDEVESFIEFVRR